MPLLRIALHNQYLTFLRNALPSRCLAQLFITTPHLANAIYALRPFTGLSLCISLHSKLCRRKTIHRRAAQCQSMAIRRNAIPKLFYAFLRNAKAKQCITFQRKAIA